MAFDVLSNDTMVSMNVKRIVQLLPIVESYVASLDLGASNVYNIEHTVESAQGLQAVLCQMDSDLTALINLLES